MKQEIKEKKRITKDELYPYTHEYYKGFFSGYGNWKLLQQLYRIDSLYTIEYFSFELYIRCVKVGIKPNRQTANWLLYEKLRGSKKKAKFLSYTDKNYKDIENFIGDIHSSPSLEEQTIFKTDCCNLVEKIIKYLTTKYSKLFVKLFILHFYNNETLVNLSKEYNIEKTKLFRKLKEMKLNVKKEYEKEYESILY